MKGSIRDEGAWRLYDKRYQPENTLDDHLTFALRHENLDLLILKRVFEAVSKREIEDFVQSSPAGMVFPVSSVMLDRIDQHRQTMQGHSGPLMDHIKWRPTPDRNGEVLNNTADLYRYFDCTEEAEFLYGCVQRTIEVDLPREIDYLGRHDAAIRRIMNTVEMPDRVAEDFLMFVRQNNGTLPNKRRTQEFKTLDDQEVSYLETIVQEEFEGFAGTTSAQKSY